MQECYDEKFEAIDNIRERLYSLGNIKPIDRISDEFFKRQNMKKKQEQILNNQNNIKEKVQ